LKKLEGVIHLKSVGSTNDFLKQKLKDKLLANWTCVYSDFQEKGRGQRGNIWSSPKGKNLLFSFYFKPKNIKAENAFLINEWVSVSINNTLENLGVKNVQIKWPNDILVNQKKICGVLVENSISGKTISESIIGIGLNVNAFPVHLKSTSIENELGVSLSVKSVMQKLLFELQKNAILLDNGLLGIRKNYLENLYGYNNNVKLKDITGEWEGRIVSVLESGIIRIEKKGRIQEYNFKEIEWLFG
jgi:BirA family biotin operon repressor/biotin-[acetyl-CoA-carboxylase] ligase